MRRRTLLVLALLAALGLGTLPALSCRAPELGLVDGRLRDCPTSPNCVCSEPDEPSSPIEPFALGDGEPLAAFARLVELVDAQPRTEVLTLEPRYAHVVFVSALLRFRDDVELRLDEGARVVHVRSASRVGYSDLGANRSRVEELRELWRSRGGRAGD